ncbi:MAG TPA: hypothetical protein VGI14_01390 [Casimicrobiaceae bacterium]|jgi:hypothetical protein
MKLGAQMTMWAALVFGAICAAAGAHGLWSLGAIADESARADARGFAWFWLFLASIALVTALLARAMARGKAGSE